MKLSIMLCLIVMSLQLSATETQVASNVLAGNDLFVVTENDMDNALSRADVSIKKELVQNDKKIKDVVNNLILIKSIAKEALENNFDQQVRIKRRLQFLYEKELSQFYVKHLMKIKKKELQGKREILEKRARELYNTNKLAYKLPLRVKVAHILLSSKAREADKLLAFDIIKKIHDGADFSALVAQYSSDKASKGNNGDIGFIKVGQTAAAFEKAAFDLTRANPISKPVKTKFGYHIIKLIERKNAGIAEFNEVREKIVQYIIATTISDYQSSYFSQKTKNVKIYVDNIQNYQKKYLD